MTLALAYRNVKSLENAVYEVERQTAERAEHQVYEMRSVLYVLKDQGVRSAIRHQNEQN